MLFTREDQCPSSGASGMVLFRGSDDELDSMSLAASECEEWAKSGDDSSKETNDVSEVKPKVKSSHASARPNTTCF